MAMPDRGPSSLPLNPDSYAARRLVVIKAQMSEALGREAKWQEVLERLVEFYREVVPE